MNCPRILIVAGSDSGGGAGIQADIKTVTMLGGHAMTAVTALTAQNTVTVAGVEAMSPDFVRLQIETTLSDLGVDAVKTGMIPNAALTEEIAATLVRTAENIPLVVDPVMVASSGSPLVTEDTVAAMKTRLFPLATLVTPNLPELALLTGLKIDNEEDMLAAALALASEHRVAVLAKGGHGTGASVVDLFVTADGDIERYESERIDTRSNHGTGCTLASAIATGLGEGRPLLDAIARGRNFVHAALKSAPGVGSGHGPLGHQFVDRNAL